MLVAAVLVMSAAAPIARQTADVHAEGNAWWAHVQYLADDQLEGRAIGTPGFELAAKYVESEFQSLGLKPAGLQGYRQPVALEARSLEPDQTTLALARDGQQIPLVLGQDATLSARGELDGAIEAPMVFVGYGMSIPEAGWDEFKGLNLKGKIAVYINAFPPVTVSDNVKSHINTADERWLALKKAGAIGVATIAVPRAGARGGAGRAGGMPRPTVVLADRAMVDAAGEKVAMTLTERGAAAVLAGTGHTIEEITQLVADKKPLPTFAIPGALRASARLKRDRIESENIVGMVEGSDPKLKNEYVVMSAHLDHLGVGRGVNCDSIYNGAMDDASGIASLIETARLLESSGVRTKRSVLFLAVTAEEKGELGSQYFAYKPTVPFKHIVADLNLDMFLPLYPLKVIEVQGLAESSLGESARAAAQSQGVEVETDREPEQ